jgi:hypothetical protein
MNDPMAVYLSRVQGGVYKRGRLQRVWFKTVQLGDVLDGPRGLRVVRAVNRHKNGDLRSLAFAIRKCSWTGSGYCSYEASALRIGGWRPAGTRYPIDGPLDCWLQADILSHGRTKTVTCCEAKDMP